MGFRPESSLAASKTQVFFVMVFIFNANEPRLSTPIQRKQANANLELL